MYAAEHFGMPESAVIAAREGHRGIIRTGLYVPSREDVKTFEPGLLSRVLSDWLWESPSEIIPNNAMIEQVLAILEARSDASELSEIIAEYRESLKSSGGL